MLWLMISILFSLLSIKMLISQCRNLLSINDSFNAKCLKKERETGKQRKSLMTTAFLSMMIILMIYTMEGVQIRQRGDPFLPFLRCLPPDRRCRRKFIRSLFRLRFGLAYHPPSSVVTTKLGNNTKKREIWKGRGGRRDRKQKKQCNAKLTMG